MSDVPCSQDNVIAFLRKSLSTPDGPPRIVTTHVSVIFLSGTRAFKMKRAVKFPFLDFRSLDARHDACEKELVINRRTAPTIYKRVCAVTRDNDGLRLDGAGEPVEWLVEMARFDESTLFDRLAGIERGLRRPMMEDLGDEIARFHGAAEVRTARGGHAGIRLIAKNNMQSFASLPSGTFDAGKVARVTSATLAMIDAETELLDARRRAGRVRVCHGDLHLRNICLVDGRPTLFDAIEFSDDFSDIDVMYDLAFLLMDLDFRGHRRLASFVLNRYLDVGDETADVFRVLPIFLTMRAQIRAHVGAAIAGAQQDAEACARERATAESYLDLALSYLDPTPPRLVAVGGLSGSGKSRLAREIAPGLGLAPGARVVRTDVIRKRLAGVHPNETLGPDGYTAAMTEATYAAFAEQARASLTAGQSVVMDAVFARADQRAEAAALAAAAGVPFTGIWVDAPEHVRVQRVEGRGRNVSDATADVARQQSGYDLGTIDWEIVDSSGNKAETVAQAVRILTGDDTATFAN